MIQGSGDKQRLFNEILFLNVDKDEILEWTIRKQGEKRSLDANNYAWALMDKIARVLRTTKEEVYAGMIQRYGTFTYLPVMEADIPMIEKVFRVVRDRGVVEMVTESGRHVFCHQMQCYKGSSLYDTKEMSRFIDGIISEAQALNIQTDTPAEIERIKAAWKDK